MIDRLNDALGDRYRVERELGAGGMATVYLADDPKHGRKVALKVLKPDLAAVVGGERFLAEIKTTANLHHPHILPLFDSGQDDGLLWYAMPFVEGESLRDRIDRERQLPVEEAVSIARKVAGALQAAHEQGVIHRDIKPANILMHRGEPVVADFGIALAVSAGASGRLTETGLSMGTPYYMSPEQATGDQAPGPASDIFALGCVLYEMLIGDPPYPGSTAQAVLGKIIQGAPVSATAERAMVPPHVDAVIRRALEKVPADRFTSAADLSVALADPSFRHGADESGVAPAAVGRWKAMALGAAAMAVGAIAVSGWVLTRPEPPARVERFESPLRGNQLPNRYGQGRYTFSADGSRMAYISFGAVGVLVRRWEDPVAQPVPGAEGARRLDLSPDGSRIVFLAEGRLQIVSVDDGASMTLGEGDRAKWVSNDELVYTAGDDLFRTRLDGTGPERIALPDGVRPADFTLLPGGGAAILYDREVLTSIDFASGTTHELVDGWHPVYSTSGHLLFIDLQDRLSAVRMDPGTLETVGTPVVLVDEVDAFALSTSGKLFYSHRPGGAPAEFVWVTRDGVPTPIESGWTFDRGAVNPGWSLSPDGRFIAYRDLVDGNDDIWIKEIPNGPRTRLTTHPASDASPRWSLDGTRIAFSSNRAGGNPDLWAARVDGVGTPELLHDDPESIIDGTWVANSELMVLRTFPGGDRGRDIVTVRPGRDSASTPILTEAYDEKQPSPSPDGRWLAYVSDETGREEVYVRPLPNVEEGRVPVSTDGGVMPVWSRDGTELFFVDGENRMVAARIATEPTFRVLDRTELFTLPTDVLSNSSNILFSVDVDDTRFLMARSLPIADEELREGDFVLVNNFHTVLNERLPNR